jgi:type II secretory pathway component PulF
VVPELEVGEVLLFLKYLFASNTARFFSKQDLPILTKVSIFKRDCLTRWIWLLMTCMVSSLGLNRPNLSHETVPLI